MNHAISFSIVTPSLNQGQFIGEALESVRQQNCYELEHLVIDGGSNDGTIGVLRECSEARGWRHLRWWSEPDHGQANALNKGFARARGEVVGWLNSDDRYLPHCFERIARAFEQYPDVDVVYGDYRWIDEAGRPYRVRREIEFNSFVLLHHRVLYIPTTATFFRRRIFQQGHFLDERLHYALDFEFFVRLARKHYRFQHLPCVLADFRFQPNSKTCSTPQRQLNEKRRITERYSLLLGALPWPVLRRGAGVLLSSSAAGWRYSEKLLRGYYF